MKKKSNKSSITKKIAWSLVLAAKKVKNSQNDDSTIFLVSKNINNIIYKFEYNQEKKKVLKNNFILDSYITQLFNIFLPIIFNTKHNPYLIGHLAQTLDGYIATESGESKYISSQDNIKHIHMLRAISDVIIVGANTVRLDNPKLTTRLVEGKSPMRITLDKKNILKDGYDVFTNKDNNSFKIIDEKIKSKNSNIFQLRVINNAFQEEDIITLINKLNKRIVFIEGGGTTISRFYESGKLDRLHLCICPIILGKGRSSFLTKKESKLENIFEHSIAHYKMGEDVLCDVDLTRP